MQMGYKPIRLANFKYLMKSFHHIPIGYVVILISTPVLLALLIIRDKKELHLLFFREHLPNLSRPRLLRPPKSS